MDKMDGMTMNIEQANVEKLRKVFPEVFADGKVDFDKLQGLLGHYIADDKEKYSFSWKGKADSLRLAQKRSTGTLRPCKEESKNWDTTENLYIEGDNLEVLKLLQSSYLNSIKMIYIDPPYNTGNDFVYTDDFADGIAHYKEVTGQATKSNPETAGRYHTNWLNMMYPRLKLARNLLTEDGVIFISIDDNEQANLKKLCDEVFGEDNFIATICHKARASISNDKIISSNHNFLHLYAKKIDAVHEKRHTIGLDPDLNGFDKTDKNGKYKLVPVDGPGGARKGNPYYEFLGIKNYWRFSKETMQEKYNNGLIVKTENGLQQKYYLDQAVNSRKTDTTWWDNDVLTSSATKELSNMLDGKFFDNPKSVNLILRELRLFTHYDKNAIILDFFSGSATTAHAIMQLNAEDGGNRKFICVQLPEKTDEQSEAYKAGYKTICEIGKERIRRAGEKIKEENKGKEGIDNLDIGFKVFKLDNSNLVKWDNTPTTDEEEVKKRIQQSLFYLVEGREDLDLVYEIMLKYGLSLTLPVEERKFDGVTAYIINHPDYKVLICLQPNITLSAVEEMDKEAIGTYIFADRCFADANILSNTEEILKKKDKEMRLF